MEGNAIETTLPNERKFSFRSVQLEVTVGHFLEDCSYPLRSKVDFQAKRFKLLKIGSVAFHQKRQV
uniref:Uncharacterized protein n=1 Tax=Romanomermis culicivorax TaxID=13658 RepID=A0A915JTM4_ROMCU